MRSASSAASSSASVRLRARAVGELRAALEPERLGVPGERLAQPRRRPRRGRASARCRGAPARRPRPAASRGRRGRRGSRRRARCAARAPRSTRGACRRATGHSAATTWSRCARRSDGRAEHELEPVGQEDRDERSRRDVGQALDRRAVDGAGASPPRAGSRPRSRGRRARPPCAARAGTPRRRSGRPRARSPSGTSDPCRRSRCASSRFVLPAPLRPAIDRHARPEPQLRLLVGAEVAQLQARGVHGSGSTRSGGSA